MATEQTTTDLSLTLLEADLGGGVLQVLAPVILEALQGVKKINPPDPLLWLSQFFRQKSEEANTPTTTSNNENDVELGQSENLANAKLGFGSSLSKMLSSRESEYKADPKSTRSVFSEVEESFGASTQRGRNLSGTSESKFSELEYSLNTGRTSVSSNNPRRLRRSKSSVEAVYRVCLRMRKLLVIKDRKYLNNVYHACFVGSEAVQWMLDSRMVRKRSRAVKVGRRMLQLGLIQHVTGDHEFKDAYLFYQFTAQASESAGAVTHSRSKLQTISARMRQSIEVRERRYHLKVYDSCFLGCDAVTWMVQSGTVPGTREAVLLGNQMMQMGLLRHSCDDQPFRNAEFFYRFAADEVGVIIEQREWEDLEGIVHRMRQSIEVRERRYHFKVYDSCFLGCDAVTWMITSKTADSTTLALSLGAALMKEGHIRHVADGEGFRNGSFFYRFAVDEDAELAHKTYNWDDPLSVAFRMREGIVCKARKATWGMHPPCFIGFEACAWMVKEGIAQNTAEALSLGSFLLEKNYIKAVGHSHRFRNGEFFYRFDLNKLVPAPLPGEPPHSLTPQKLQKLCQQMSDSIEICDRKQGLHKYPGTFLGCDAVAWMLSSGEAASEAVAHAMGNDMMVAGYLRHIIPQQPFANDMGFYTFNTDALFAVEGEVDIGDDTDTEEVLDVGTLMEHSERMRAGIQVLDRKYRGRKFQLTFLGSDAVAWMLMNEVAQSVPEAVVLGNQMMQFGMFRHVTDGHRFKNKRLFYRFKPDELRVRANSLNLRRNPSIEDSMSEFTSAGRTAGGGGGMTAMQRLAAAKNTRDVPFDDILTNPNAFKHLNGFAGRTFCGENTSFVRDCVKLLKREAQYGPVPVPLLASNPEAAATTNDAATASTATAAASTNAPAATAVSAASPTPPIAAAPSPPGLSVPGQITPRTGRGTPRTGRGTPRTGRGSPRRARLRTPSMAPPTNPVSELAEYMYNTYITQESLLMINLPAKAYTELVRRYEAGERSSAMFDAAQHVIQELLRSDVFPRFRESIEYLDMVEALDAQLEGVAEDAEDADDDEGGGGYLGNQVD